MLKNQILKGRIVSGARKAAFFTQLDWVLEQCSEKLGFKPFPGTLNIELLPENLPDVESIQEEKRIELVPPDPKFCNAQVFPVSIEEVDAAIIILEEKVRVHGRNVIEVIAPMSLKGALNIDDGDTVTIILKDQRIPGVKGSSDPPQNRRIKILKNHKEFKKRGGNG